MVSRIECSSSYLCISSLLLPKCPSCLSPFLQDSCLHPAADSIPTGDLVQHNISCMTFLVIHESCTWSSGHSRVPVLLHYYKYLFIPHSLPLGSLTTRTMFPSRFSQMLVAQPNSKLLKHRGNVFAHVTEKSGWLWACLEIITLFSILWQELPNHDLACFFKCFIFK